MKAYLKILLFKTQLNIIQKWFFQWTVCTRTYSSACSGCIKPLKFLMTCELLELVFPIQTGRLGEGFIMALWCQLNPVILCRLIQTDLLKQIWCSVSHRGSVICGNRWSNVVLWANTRIILLAMQETNRNWKAVALQKPCPVRMGS